MGLQNKTKIGWFDRVSESPPCGQGLSSIARSGLRTMKPLVPLLNLLQFISSCLCGNESVVYSPIGHRKRLPSWHSNRRCVFHTTSRFRKFLFSLSYLQAKPISLWPKTSTPSLVFSTQRFPYFYGFRILSHLTFLISPGE